MLHRHLIFRSFTCTFFYVKKNFKLNESLTFLYIWELCHILLYFRHAANILPLVVAQFYFTCLHIYYATQILGEGLFKLLYKKGIFQSKPSYRAFIYNSVQMFEPFQDWNPHIFENITLSGLAIKPF